MSATSLPNHPAGCSCCGAIAIETPVEIVNRPGLSALAYRIGTQQQFKDTMLDRLGSGVTGLLTRQDSDFSIAMLDAFACAADTLTFYQQYIANESYLATATERRSLIELGRLIDYKARAGVAASAHLAFTVENAPGAPELAAPPVTIGVGLKVQSVPAQGQLPMTFETVEEAVVHPEWNAMRPQLTEPQVISVDMQSVVLNGTSSGIQPGDRILIVADTDADQRVALEVMSVVPQAGEGNTLINLAIDPPEPARPSRPIFPFHVFSPDVVRLTSDLVRSSVLRHSWRQADLDAFVRVQRWSPWALMKNIKWQVGHRAFPPATGVFSFGDRAAIFGNNAPSPGSSPTTPGLPAGQTLQMESDANLARAVDLDRAYPSIVPGSWLLLKSPTSDHIIYQVEDALELSRADFGLSAKVTRLLLSSDDSFDSLSVRETTVFARSNSLDLAELPITDDVAGTSITLDNVYLGLQVGQKVIVSGERSDLGGVVDNEVMVLAEVNFSDGLTTLVFQQALNGIYLRNTITINANVVMATHGETVQETVGGGNASVSGQSFALRQPPLTYVSSNSPSGSDSTLQLRVNDLLWHEAPSFFNRAARERVFVTHTADDGTTTVQFGDGVNGARPATGVDNIRATYRKGTGTGGNVDAQQLSLMQSRPQGVRSVANPLPASGGVDPEAVDSIRRNAPLTIMTMDRIVSLQDYEDFAYAFAGIAKAMAVPWTSSGHARGVFITIAGPDGAAIDRDGVTYTNLLAAIQQAGVPNVPLEVQSYRNAYFELTATIIVKPAFQIDSVVAAVEQALRAQFSFDARAFGQPVMLSEVVATMQAVPGVVAVDIDRLSRIGNLSGGVDRLRRVDSFLRFNLLPPASLSAAVPEMLSDGTLLAAELLTLDPRPVDLRGVLP
jgi:predicted phage baseplate assembly protein